MTNPHHDIKKTAGYIVGKILLTFVVNSFCVGLATGVLTIGLFLGGHPVLAVANLFIFPLLCLFITLYPAYQRGKANTKGTLYDL